MNTHANTGLRTHCTQTCFFYSKWAGVTYRFTFTCRVVSLDIGCRETRSQSHKVSGPDVVIVALNNKTKIIKALENARKWEGQRGRGWPRQRRPTVKGADWEERLSGREVFRTEEINRQQTRDVRRVSFSDVNSYVSSLLPAPGDWQPADFFFFFFCLCTHSSQGPQTVATIMIFHFVWTVCHWKDVIWPKPNVVSGFAVTSTKVRRSAKRC